QCEDRQQESVHSPSISKTGPVCSARSARVPVARRLFDRGGGSRWMRFTRAEARTHGRVAGMARLDASNRSIVVSLSHCPHQRSRREAIAPRNTTAAAGDGAIAASFRAFIDAPSFPCVGSKAALARGAIRTREFAPLGQRANDIPLL